MPRLIWVSGAVPCVLNILKEHSSAIEFEKEEHIKLDLAFNNVKPKDWYFVLVCVLVHFCMVININNIINIDNNICSRTRRLSVHVEVEFLKFSLEKFGDN